jgi:hypothetical protein
MFIYQAYGYFWHHSWLDTERKIFAYKISSYYSACFFRGFSFIYLSFRLFCIIIYIISLYFYTFLCLKFVFLALTFFSLACLLSPVTLVHNRTELVFCSFIRYFHLSLNALL